MLYNIFLCGLIFSVCSAVHAGPALVKESLEPVSVQLRYLHQFQFAGFYAAIDQGYYKQEGLEVTLIEATLGEKAVDAVLAGRAEYGQTQTSLLYSRLQGKPLVALAPIFQHSPTALMVLKSSGVNSPHDLVGKRIMLEVGDNAISLLAMLKLEGVKSSDIEVIQHSYTLDELIAGEVDAVGVYLTDQPFLAKKLGVAFRVLNPISYGIDFYGDTLFTTEDEVRRHPERVERFLRATLRGWQHAMNHSDEIIDLILTQYNTKKTREDLVFEAQVMKTLMLPELIEIGNTNLGRWQRMANILVKQDSTLPENYSLEHFIYQPNKSWDKQYWIRYFFGALGLLLVVTLFFLYYWQLSKRLKGVIFERNEAEKNSLRLGHVLEQSSNEIYIFDVDTLKFIQVNEGGRKNLGYSMEELQSLTPLDLKPDYTQTAFNKLIAPLRVGSQQQVVFITRHRRKNGSFYPVEVRLQLYDVPGQAVYYAIINDITDRQRIDRELREKNRDLEQFIYMISHDLKSPLVTVKTFLSYLQQDIKLSDKTRVAEDLGFMASATDKMSMLLNDLLEFSRVGRQEKSKTSITFEQLTDDVIALSAGSIVAGKVKVGVEKVDLTLFGDRAELVQVWQNLVENSIKYMGNQANPQIDLGVKVINGDTVFYVKDNGMGIDPKYHEKIFKIFEQLNANIEGSGLGLALVKRIVEQYQGQVSVESKGSEQGTCIQFTLPEAVNFKPSGGA